MNTSPLTQTDLGDPGFRSVVFNDLESVPVGTNPSPLACQVAFSLWSRITWTSVFKASCQEAKLLAWQCVVEAALRAGWIGGCIRYGRNRAKTNQITQQVIACAVEQKILLEVPSKRGGKHFSRLLVSEELLRYVPADPWEITAAPKSQPLVYMRSREFGEWLEFDWLHPVAADTVRKLELINAVNARFNITFQRYCPLSRGFVGERRLRPVSYRLFHENWWHGRLYTHGRDGHTNLRKIERPTIRFDGQQSVELDYSAMHPRMIYHLIGMDYRDDPYALWADQTTKARRALAKLVVNISINALDHALAACHAALQLKDKDDKPKRGKDREQALKLRDARNGTGLDLKDVHDLAKRFHWPISGYLGSRMGAELMRLDSDIALGVLYSFALEGIPALGVHDSFIVPELFELKLREVMEAHYQQRLLFPPSIK